MHMELHCSIAWEPAGPITLEADKLVVPACLPADDGRRVSVGLEVARVDGHST